MARPRSKLCGVGVNDGPKNNNKCPYYQRWQHMITRCYSEKFHAKQRSYRGCIVCKEWHLFSNFKKWMEGQDWEGKELDKDILIQGNKIYSPDSCVFVDKRINTLLNDNGASRGLLSQGVTFNKRNKKFVASCKNKGLRVCLGSYDSVGDAARAYVDFKSKLIRELAEGERSDVRDALVLRSEMLVKTLDK